MPTPFRLTVVNPTWDPDDLEPEALLSRVATFTGWCDAMRASGVPVEVVQRFSRDADVARNGVRYRFVGDDAPARLAAGDAGRAVGRAVVTTRPDVVHVNGLACPALVASLRAALGAWPLIVVRDNDGSPPPRGRTWLDAWRRRRWSGGLSGADAVSFTAPAHADPWRAAGILGEQDVLALVAHSTTMRAPARDEARARTGLSGDPLVLAVGRLAPGGDPLTTLNGFERLAVRHPQARLVIASPGGPLWAAVRSRVETSPVLMTAVRLLGDVADRDRADLYGAADVFVSGSHHDQRGDALIDALACGVLPVVTSIPAFEAIAGSCGLRFTPGDAAACAGALGAAASVPAVERRRRALARFDAALSWSVLAAQTTHDYEALLAHRRPRRGAPLG